MVITDAPVKTFTLEYGAKMAAFPWGALIGAGATLGAAGLGAATSRSPSDNSWQIPLQTQHDFDMFNLNQNYNWSMAAYQNAYNRESAAIDADRQYAYATEMANRQREWEGTMAQNSIGWRVGDAQRAGVSPLVALGAPTFNPSPTTVGIGTQSAPANPGGPLSGPSAIGAAGSPGTDNSWLAKVGANIGDIAMKALTPEDQRAIAREEMLTSQKIAYNDELLKGVRLDNAMKLKNMSGRAANPDAGSNPLSGQNPALGKFSIEAVKVPSSSPDVTGQHAGTAPPDAFWRRTPTGLAPIPDPKSAAGQDPSIFNPEYVRWATATYINPHASRAPTPEIFAANGYPGAKGARWNQWTLEWEPVYR